jgi:hypothetical protein
MRWSGNILGKRAIPAVGEIAEHRIADLKLRDIAPNRCNPPGDVSPEDLVLWLAQPRREPNHERVAAQKNPITGIERCRMDLDQDVSISERRFFNLCELKNVR